MISNVNIFKFICISNDFCNAVDIVCKQGVKAVIAESYHEAYRSGLVMIGVLPLEYLPGQNAASLSVSGREQFSISLTLSKNISVHQTLEVKVCFDSVFMLILA